jgi:hypothetical protein
MNPLRGEMIRPRAKISASHGKAWPARGIIDLVSQGLRRDGGKQIAHPAE